MDDVTSRIVAACNGTEFFLTSLVAIALIDKIGRRKLMLFGAVGQCLTMALLGILGAIDNSATQVVSAVLLFVFPTFFAIGWLGMTWLYVRLHISLANILKADGVYSPQRSSASVFVHPPTRSPPRVTGSLTSSWS